jgi:hypothetical protein
MESRRLGGDARPAVPVHARRTLLRAACALACALLLVTALVPAPWLGAARATPGYPQAEVVIHGTPVRVDVADNPTTQALGLGGRTALGPREGMLFVYADKEPHTFWMRGMRIAIDMIWLDNHTVVHIEHDVPPPPPGRPETDLPTYRPPVPANFVLELAAGRARALGLRVGDRVQYRFGVAAGRG